jgi:hypothetical protein
MRQWAEKLNQYIRPNILNENDLSEIEVMTSALITYLWFIRWTKSLTKDLFMSLEDGVNDTKDFVITV